MSRKRWIAPTLAVAALVASFVNHEATTDRLAAEAAARAERTVALTTQREALDETVAQTWQDAGLSTAGAPSGELEVAAERVERDRQVLSDLAGAVFTWNSTDSYNAARAHLAKVAGADEDDELLRTFMPPAPVNVDSTGREYGYIEAAGLNSRFGGLRTLLLGVRGTQYDYLALVTVQGASLDGSTTASRTVTMLASVEVDGSVTSLSAWASPSGVKRSG